MADAYNKNVFINCPFDHEYSALFEAMCFCILYCGYTPRCAKENGNSLSQRLTNILRIIRECQFGIHDISRTQTDNQGRPRFNMPFEAGLFYGAHEFGAGGDKKHGLMLASLPHEYDAYFSDLSGNDIRYHRDDAERLVGQVQEWLNEAHLGDGDDEFLPSQAVIREKYLEFQDERNKFCAAHRYDTDLPYRVFIRLASKFVRRYQRQARTV